MNSALFKLYRLRIKGYVRAGLRQFATIRGAALAMFTLIVLGLMLGPNLLIQWSSVSTDAGRMGEGAARNMFPIGLCAYCLLTILTSVGERAIYFSPSEIDFLFPSPFSRRQLLVYKILSNATGVAIVAMFLASIWVSWIPWWPSAVFAIALGFLMVNGLSMCVQLIGQTVSESADTRLRRVLLLVVVGLGVWGIARTVAGGVGESWTDAVERFRVSTAGSILLAPFEVYGRILQAERLTAELLGWTTLGLTIVAAVYGLALTLDANYLESSIRVSQRIQKRLRQARAGGVFATFSERSIKATRLPPFPWLGGAGPIAHRQVLEAWRAGRGYLTFVVVILVAMSIPVATVLRDNPLAIDFSPVFVIGAMAYLTFLVSSQAPLSFRGDLERMDYLKSLPLRPIAVAAGQLSIVTLLATLMHWFAFGLAGFLLTGNRRMLLPAALFSLPFNLIVFGIENALFLLFPTRLPAGASGGVLFVGRVFLTMIVKFLVLLAAVVLCSIPAALVFALTGRVWPAILAAWFAFLLPSGAVVVAVAWAFRRFDPSDE